MQNKQTDYDPHLQGSDHLPDATTPEKAETRVHVERARQAVRLSQEANKLAERGNRK
jgi:hypothetical protein